MVKIPDQYDPTIRAMYEAIANSRVNEQRDYIGASEIGDECSRKIWYNYNNYPKEKSGYEDISTMAADSGHYAEEKTAERLRLLPFIELHTHMDNGEQYGWERLIKLDYPNKVIDPKTGEITWQEYGKLSGHFDGLIRGILQAPKKIHIWEHKDKDHKKFADFQNKKSKYGEKNVLKEWNETYYGQAQNNMHNAHLDGVQVNRHYMTVSYAGGRKYDSCRTDYDPEYAERLNFKSIKILNAGEPLPRLSEKSDFFLCRFCDFKDECHG